MLNYKKTPFFVLKEFLHIPTQNTETMGRLNHLIVFVHGLNGSRNDFRRWHDPFKEIFNNDENHMVFFNSNFDYKLMD